MKLNGRDITVDTIVAVKRDLLAAVASGDTVVDFEGAGRIDSTAVSLLLSLLRRCDAIRIEHAPDDLRTLVRLYGVHELFAGRGL